MQDADNLIPNQVRLLVYSLGCTVTGVIKTASNIMIYCPRVFHVMYGPNQSYSPEYGWECLSPYSNWR